MTLLPQEDEATHSWFSSCACFRHIRRSFFRKEKPSSSCVSRMSSSTLTAHETCVAPSACHMDGLTLTLHPSCQGSSAHLACSTIVQAISCASTYFQSVPKPLQSIPRTCKQRHATPHTFNTFTAKLHAHTISSTFTHDQAIPIAPSLLLHALRLLCV